MSLITERITTIWECDWGLIQKCGSTIQEFGEVWTGAEIEEQIETTDSRIAYQNKRSQWN